jgi:phosphotransferase family enzyme
MPMPMEAELRSFVERAVGPFRLEHDRSWEHGGAQVLQLRDAAGVAWYVKRPARTEHYERERTAYLRWVPALGDRAPALRAYDDKLGVLLLSAVPGTLDYGAGAGVHHDAGRVLRRLHESETLPVWTDFAAVKLAELESWTEQAATLLDAADLDFARGSLRALEGVPAPVQVPCHLDYTPRNWLIAGGGRVHVIDFEWVTSEVWVNDIARLYYGYWRGRPDLREAFLAGYGRTPSDDDLAIMRGSYALSAVWMIVWAHEHGELAFETGLRDNLKALRHES